MSEFWNNEIEVGYYDKIVQKGMIKKRTKILLAHNDIIEDWKLSK